MSWSTFGPDNITENAVVTTPEISQLETGGPDLSTLTIVFMVTGIIGVVSNIFVVGIIMAYKPMQQSTANVFIVHQSVIDSIGSFLFLVGFEASYHTHFTNSIADELYCRVWKSTTLHWICYFTSIYNLVALNIDRWLKICHPMWHRVKMTRVKMY